MKVAGDSAGFLAPGRAHHLGGLLAALACTLAFAAFTTAGWWAPPPLANRIREPGLVALSLFHFAFVFLVSLGFPTLCLYAMMGRLKPVAWWETGGPKPHQSRSTALWDRELDGETGS